LAAGIAKSASLAVRRTTFPTGVSTDWTADGALDRIRDGNSGKTWQGDRSVLKAAPFGTWRTGLEKHLKGLPQ
jgi:hypothetical protein